MNPDVWSDPDGIWRQVGTQTYGPFATESEAETFEPFLVVCFGMLSYKILSAHGDEAEAKRELRRWQGLARKGEAEVLPLYRKGRVGPSDFDVRTQSDLDALTSAIIGSYE